MERTTPNARAAIAGSIKPTRPTERTALYARVIGLSEREGDLLHHLVSCSDTRERAERLYMSEKALLRC